MNTPGLLRDFLDEKCKHRPSESKHYGTSESSDEEPPYKKSYREEGRKERRRSNNTKAFKETLQKAETMNLECSSDMEVHNCKIQFTVTTAVGHVHNVEIGETPSCTCDYHSNPRKIKHTCKRIVWVLLNKFGVHPSNAIFAQMSFTVSEINIIFNQQCNQSQSGKPGYAKQNINITRAEIQAIFETKGEGPQKWYVDKLLTRKEAKCCTCSSTMSAETLYVFVNGLYIFPGQHFAKERTFYFCALMKCLGKKPYMNNLQVPPITFETRNSRLTKDERHLLRSRGLRIKL